MLTAYTDRAYICENTGSRHGCREWFFGIKTKVWYHESALERFLKSENPQILRHRWTSYNGTGYSLIPVMKSFGHGRPGLILTPSREMLDDYVLSLSREDRLELYHVFCSADDDLIKDHVQYIFDAQD